MNIDLDKINEIYGMEMLKLINSNIGNVNNNLTYFNSLGFDDYFDYLERLPMLFILDFRKFKNKIDTLINKLGHDYVDIIENDIGVLDDII